MGIVKRPQDVPMESTSIPIICPENSTLPSMDSNENGSSYILIPLGTLLCISILALLVCLMVSNKKRIVYMYYKKRNDHRFFYEDNEYDSPLEQDVVEEEEDEVDNEDNPTKSLLKGKLQINNRYENYLSTSHLNRSSDLFT